MKPKNPIVGKTPKIKAPKAKIGPMTHPPVNTDTDGYNDGSKKKNSPLRSYAKSINKRMKG